MNARLSIPRALAIAALGVAALTLSLPRGAHAERLPVPAQQLIEVKDGAEVNLAQAQLQINAEGRKIFVPQPRGADDTLDDSAKGGKKGEGDVVTTIRGDKIVGKVLTIETGGKLHLTAPHFEGEVVILASALDTVELNPTEKAKGDDEVALSNDDRIVGEVASITPEAVIIETKATGPVKVDRKIIRSISFARGSVTALESNFESGKIEPWTARGGGWTVANGALTCNTQGDCQTVFAKFDQREAITMEAKVQATFGRYIHVELILAADNTEGQYGTNSLIARFYASQFNLMVMQNGGMNSFADRHIGRLMTEATVRVAYDPASNKARAWLDSTDLGEYAVPGNVAPGKFVMFNARYPCRVTRLRVVQGVVGPTAVEKEETTDAHVVRFVNRDRVAATDLALAEGKLTLKTAFGDIAAEVGKVQNINFQTKGIEKPRRNKGDVLVETFDSRFTLQFERLTDQYLIGKSGSLGDVKVLRSCLKRISFNVYK
ncbi:MAG TPA: hypothetical protein PLE19_21270 [Planctomycetota bacterium]|nr:hypothetical protein [Planctomycetota bacterium]HRR82158.1 hypothetical protein [Planctomycetota bacterium]HRT96279.1 hypothetical protein [Planctomycetota bacterium]